MNSDSLNYDDDGFPVRARKLISNRQTFSFEVGGAAYRELVPLLSNGRIADPPKLGLRPKLQVLLAILMLADGQGQPVSLEIEEERIRIRVGVGSA